jgi:hypothetical protein
MPKLGALVGRQELLVAVVDQQMGARWLLVLEFQQPVAYGEQVQQSCRKMVLYRPHHVIFYLNLNTARPRCGAEVESLSHLMPSECGL